MGRLLVTGAGGFLGSRVATRFRLQGHTVTTAGRGGSGSSQHAALGPSPWGRDAWIGLLRANDYDTVFHLAGTASGSPSELEATNVASAEGLFAALCDLPRRPAVVLIGSAAEYGNAIRDGIPVREGDVCAPGGPYGITKLRQTTLALDHMARTGDRVLVVRIFNLLGAGLPRNLAMGSFAAQIAAFPAHGGTLTTGNLNVARDFIDVDDAASALLALGLQNDAKGIVNLCSGEAIPLRLMVEELIKQSGRPVTLTTDPARLREGEPSVIIGSTELQRSYGVALNVPNVDRIVESMLGYELAKAKVNGSVAA